MELVRKQLNGYRVLPSQVQRFEQQTDMIIPDVNPDAMTVLGAWGSCIVSEQQVRKDRITAGGTVNFTLLYQPESGGGAIPLQGSMNFQEVLELKQASEEDILFLQAEIVDLRGIILNSRKLGVQCRIALFAWAYQRESILLTEGVQAKPEEGIQQRLEQKQMRQMVSVFEKNLSVQEEVRIGDALEQGQLLHSVLLWKTEDVRTLHKKVMVRGAAQLRVIMLRENEELQELTYALPFSQIVESNDVQPDCSAELNYVTSGQQLRLERREDGLFLLCSLQARFLMEVYRERDFSIISDLYSICCESQVQYCPIPVSGCGKEILTSHLQEQLRVDTQPRRVLHTACCGATAEIQAGKLLGCAVVSVCWEDEEGRRHHQWVMLREEQTGEYRWQGAAKIFVQSVAAVITGDQIRVEVQVQYTLRKSVRWEGQQVERCQLDREQPRCSHAPGTLLLRTVGRGETAWDLARDYGTTEAAILSANKMSVGEALEENQLVMIPFLRK